ncbi:hypothetical protein SAMN05444920_106415 [Nonomuraea solani]|uniref:Uncharacterized protein n=1 Tax=Nonomuraea solani TaxID=1144553 RepID=A0A1H6DVF7_9ACTN|nr:hypothetical protein [Nonomuraea solani]SEG89250.1 hypothetical protein SAMN05444920_106415 [Nonomuraea solani]
MADDDAWYHSIVTGRRQTLDTVRLTMTAVETYGLDNAVGQRLAKIESADRWRSLLTVPADPHQ